MSTDSESLSSILSGSSAFAPSAPETPATDDKPVIDTGAAEGRVDKITETAAPSAAKEAPEVSKETKEPQRDESGRFAKAETKAEKAEPMVPLSALLAERAKRQNPETPKPKTSVLDNEDQAFNERLTEHTEPLRKAVFEMSVEFARSRYEDFNEVASVFSKAAESDPRLWDHMRTASNPAMYVYQVGKQFAELAPFGGDLLRYRSHITSEASGKLTEAEKRIQALEAELTTIKKGKAELDAVPRSLNSSGSGAQPTVADTDPEDIRSIVRFGNK